MSGEMEAVCAANVTLDTENAKLRQALRVIRKGLTDDQDGEFWTARNWLDRRGIYHGNLSGLRVLELVAKHALHGSEDEPVSEASGSAQSEALKTTPSSNSGVSSTAQHVEQLRALVLLDFDNLADTTLMDGERERFIEALDALISAVQAQAREHDCGKWAKEGDRCERCKADMNALLAFADENRELKARLALMETPQE